MIGLAGRTLDHYTLEQRVGKGGMADVYLGFDPHFQRPVAVKVFKQDSDGMLRRFMREANIMSALHHPHLMPIYGTGESELDGVTRYYIVMPFIDGGTLGKRIQRSILSPDEASRYLFDIASALDYLHRHGIIHRDIKSTNVLLGKDDLCYLSDLGVARIVDDTSSLTTTGNVLGTVDYIAPELFVGDGKADAHSDIYSLGVLLYEMITGRRPFAAENQVALASMHVNQPPPLPRLLVPNISPQVEQVVLKALEKDPESRFPTASALADAFYHATRVQQVITTGALNPLEEDYDQFSPSLAVSLAQDVTQGATAPAGEQSVGREKKRPSLLPSSQRARLFIALCLFLAILVAIIIPSLFVLQAHPDKRQASMQGDALSHPLVVITPKAPAPNNKKKVAQKPLAHSTPTPVHTATPVPTTAPRPAPTTAPTSTPMPTVITKAPLAPVNLVQDPGYEQQTSTLLVPPWIGTPVTTGVDVNAGSAHSGANNGWINVGPNNVMSELGQHVKVTPNTAYALTVYYRTSPDINPSLLGVSGEEGNIIEQVSYNASPGNYTPITFVFNSASENSVYIYIKVQGPANAWLQVDDWDMHSV